MLSRRDCAAQLQLELTDVLPIILHTFASSGGGVLTLVKPTRPQGLCKGRPLQRIGSKKTRVEGVTGRDAIFHLGARLRGRTATWRSKKGSEKVLERVLGKGSQKGSEKGACYGLVLL